MPFYERGPNRIHYEEAGSGFPLLIIPGGGLNSTVAGLQRSGPFNPMETYKEDFRCIAADLRNANGGQSSGPLEIDRPWDAHSDDQLGLMDHLGIKEFMVMGFCIGGPLIHNLLRLAQERIVAAALMQPSGFRPDMPDIFYQNNITGWGPPLCEKRPEITMDMVHNFLTSMYTDRADFVFHRFPRFRACPADTTADSARRCAGAPIRVRDGGCQPGPELRGNHFPLERLAGAHRRGGSPRPALPEGP